MIINISQKEQLTVETFSGSANGGKSFTGIRFRTGKRKPKTIFHCHHSKAHAVIDALQSCLNSITEETGNFYESPAWQRLRYETLKKYRQCCLCGSNDKLHVDHIKPRSNYPELELEPDNMQVLCQKCNIAKSNHDTEDYRNHYE